MSRRACWPTLAKNPPLYRETTQQRLLIELLTALRAGNLRENLTQGLIEAICSQADDLWRGGHPAAADTIEATASAIRGTDKALAKQLRRSAHKARTGSAETRGGLACGPGPLTDRGRRWRTGRRREGQRFMMTVVTGSLNLRSAWCGRSVPSQREMGWGSVATMISSN